MPKERQPSAAELREMRVAGRQEGMEGGPRRRAPRGRAGEATGSFCTFSPGQWHPFWNLIILHRQLKSTALWFWNGTKLYRAVGLLA